MARADELFEIR